MLLLCGLQTTSISDWHSLLGCLVAYKATFIGRTLSCLSKIRCSLVVLVIHYRSFFSYKPLVKLLHCVLQLCGTDSMSGFKLVLASTPRLVFLQTAALKML